MRRLFAASQDLVSEINTPLGTISAHAEEALELLKTVKHGRLTAEQQTDLGEHLRAIMRQAQRCSRTTARLLHVLPRRECPIVLGSGVRDAGEQS